MRKMHKGGMSFQLIFRSIWARYVLAVALVAVATALRIWPLEALGSTLAWLTFYPAVMVAAIYGGFYAGLLATVLACLSIMFLWPILAAHPFIDEPADWLGMSVFVLTCTMISGVAEAMRRANEKVQKSEARYSALVEQAVDGIFVADSQGRYIDVNRAGCYLLGYSREEFLKLTFPDILDPTEIPRLRSQLVRLSTEESVISDWQFLRKDGSTFFGEIRGKLLSNGNYLGYLIDITKRKKAEELLITAKEQAEAASQAKSVFLSTMSHELRTPLNAILGFSTLMRSDPDLTAGQRGNLDIIIRSGGHLLSLINDVLDMAKIEAGRVVLEIESFDLAALARDVTDMLGRRAEERGLQLRLDQAEKFSEFIRCDKEKLRRVLINLVGNAIKYTNRGSVILRLATQAEDSGLRLIIEVEDSGIGISQTDQARIFEPFVQVGKSGTQKGTGLGLAIVREYVELMGGKVSVESTPDVGSLFRVSLPVQSADETEVPQADTVKRRVIGLESGQPEYRILIVEDQLENQLLLQRMLEDVGFTVKLAENGAEGVELFKSFHPHFIWMDRRMPVMDGTEATQRIRALDGGREVKIVVVSASVFGEQREETMAHGIDDFVRKPYRPTDIFDCMSRHLGVRYRYGPNEPVIAESELTAVALNTLPDAIRRELAAALVNGNTEHISELMLRIGKQDAALARVLAYHLTAFNYLPVLNALEAAGENGGEKS